MFLLERKKLNGTLETIHFIGIGGIGMSGIAEIMHNMGYKIQGSDLVTNYNTIRLANLGIKIFEGHKAENLGEVSYIVISSDVNYQNIEVIEAISRKIPVIKRAEMLAELMRLKCSVAISGSHGKTTTTSLTACLFEAASLSPTVINGGIINTKLTNAYLGNSDYLIVEADESDATFINIPSTIAVITNIDPEHMNFYKDFDSLKNAFKSFINNLPFYGFAVVCIDHPVVRELIQDIKKRKVITYGIDSPDANICAFNIKTDISSSTFDVKINFPNIDGTAIIENITIPTPGLHNVLNSLAAIGIGAELDFGIKVIKNGFKKFKGVKRRFTKTGEFNGASIIDDYAHHPVEIAATLATARTVVNKSNGRVIAIFQPHRYSRVHNLFDDFTRCFSDADELYIVDIFSAGEDKIEGISAEALVKKISATQSHKNVHYLSSYEEVVHTMKNSPKPGDIVLMMGAGNITTWANQLPAELKDTEQ